MVILPLVRTVVFGVCRLQILYQLVQVLTEVVLLVVSALFSLIVMGLAGGALATSAANHVDT